MVLSLPNLALNVCFFLRTHEGGFTSASDSYPVYPGNETETGLSDQSQSVHGVSSVHRHRYSKLHVLYDKCCFFLNIFSPLFLSFSLSFFRSCFLFACFSLSLSLSQHMVKCPVLRSCSTTTGPGGGAREGFRGGCEAGGAMTCPRNRAPRAWLWAGRWAERQSSLHRGGERVDMATGATTGTSRSHRVPPTKRGVPCIQV